MKAGELEKAVINLITRVTGASASKDVPSWLKRPGKVECGRRWPLVQDIYSNLTGLTLPEVMPSKETRRLDAVLLRHNAAPRILEIDEGQHFNKFRAATLLSYMDVVPVAFDAQRFLDASRNKLHLEGGGFAKPRPPLFPEQDGRHLQRAFRDALTDILPVDRGYAPTLRIAHFDVESWILSDDAEHRMRALIGNA